MEESITRKRIIEKPQTNHFDDESSLKIYEEVFIISCLRPEIPRICDALSLSLRIAALCDLSFKNLIDINEETRVTIKIDGNITDPILNEFHHKLRDTDFRLYDTILALNGESFSRSRLKLHVKKMRERISKGLEERNILRYGKNKYKFFRGKVYVDEKIKTQLTQKILSYLEDKSYCLRTEIVIGCLVYCNSVKPLLFSIPQNKIQIVQGKIDEIRKRFLSTTVKPDPPERFLFAIMKNLLKM